MCKVHRLVLEAFIGPCPDGMETRHLDGNSQNNRLSNLCWGTHQENMADSKRHGTTKRAKGEHNHNAKLTNMDIQNIRRYSVIGHFSQQELANAFGITQGHINNIIKRRIWKHI